MQTRSSDNDESAIVYSPADDQVEDSNIPGREMLKPATAGARGRMDCGRGCLLLIIPAEDTYENWS